MEPKSPQFSAYDFLGYLLPGLLLLALIDCTYQAHGQGNGNKEVITWTFITARYGELSWNNAIPLSFFGYFFGHIISFASAVVIEGHATRMHGYPAEFLIRLVQPNYFGADRAKVPWFRWKDVPLFLGKLGLVLFLLPIPIAERLLMKFMGLSRRLSPPMKPIMRMCVTAAEDRLLVALDARTPLRHRPQRRDGEVYWGGGLEKIGLHYALEMAPAHVFSLRNYVVLYGFLRAMTLILLLVMWIGAFHLWHSDRYAAFIWWSIVGLIATVTYGAFLKFWTRYHREALMAFLAASARAPKE